MKTTLKYPQGPYWICTRVFRTGERNKRLTGPCGLRITNFALEPRWHQIPCVFIFFCYYTSSIARATLRLFKVSFLVVQYLIYTFKKMFNKWNYIVQDSLYPNLELKSALEVARVSWIWSFDLGLSGCYCNMANTVLNHKNCAVYHWLSIKLELESQKCWKGFRFTVGLLTLVLVFVLPGDRVGLRCV